MWPSASVLSLVSMNKYFRCVGILLIVLLSGCDSDKPPVPAPAPTPKVAVENPTVEAKIAALPAVEAPKPAAVDAPSIDPAKPFAEAAPAAPFKQLEREPAPVHTLAPNVVVVPVTAAQSQSAPIKKPVTAKSPASPVVVKTATDKSKGQAANDKTRPPITSKTKPAHEVVQQTKLIKPTLDLSLPTEMADSVQPVGKVAPISRKGVLPQMFSEKKSTKDSPFQLNGRLLSNEMQLQRRDEDRRGVEGAALDFEFKQ